MFEDIWSKVEQKGEMKEKLLRHNKIAQREYNKHNLYTCLNFRWNQANYHCRSTYKRWKNPFIDVLNRHPTIDPPELKAVAYNDQQDHKDGFLKPRQEILSIFNYNPSKVDAYTHKLLRKICKYADT